MNLKLKNDEAPCLITMVTAEMHLKTAAVVWLCVTCSEHGHADVPSFYTCDEGLSALTQEGQATLERLEGMLAQSVAQQYHMAGVRTEETKAEFEGLSRTNLNLSSLF